MFIPAARRDGEGSDLPEETRVRALTISPVMAALRTIRRRIWFIVGIAAALTAIAAVLAFELPANYRAEAMIVLDSRREQVINIQDVMSGLPSDNASLRSEMDILMSNPIAGKVIDKLNLVNNPDLNPQIDKRPTLIGRSLFWLDEDAQRRVDEWLQGLFSFGDTLGQMSPQDRAQRVRQGVILNYLHRLEVTTDGRSLTIKVAFTLGDPTLAARIVNAHAEIYQLDQLEAKFEATRRANTWLTQRVDELRKNVRDADRAVQEYREQANLIGPTQDSTVLSQQLAGSTAQLIQMQGELSQKEARLAQLRDVMRNGGNVDSIPEVLNSATIQSLKAQEAQLAQQEADMSQRLGPKHPQLLALRAQLHDVRNAIRREMLKIVASLQQDVDVARGRTRALGSSVDQLQKKVGNLNLAEVKLRELQQEADSSRTLFESFLERFKETSAGPTVDTPDARIVSPAPIPLFPSSPNRPLILVLGVIMGTVIGVGLAFLVEQLDDTVHSSEDVERETGIPGIGLIPIVRTSMMDGVNAANAAVRKPLSNYAEAIRGVRTSIMMSNVDRPPRVILITSALPNEGKTVLSIALGRSAAVGGRRVIVVDCDLRRATLLPTIGLEGKGNVVEVLMGEKTLEEVIVKDTESNLDVLPGKTNVANSLDLVSSAQFAKLLDRLRESYDEVIIDSPPVLAVSDALALGRLVDTTVFAARWGGTTLPVVTGALKQLRSVSTRIAGVVLTRVNPRKHATYGYGDYGYYYGKYYYGRYSGYYRR